MLSRILVTSCHPWGVLLCIWIVFQECCPPPIHPCSEPKAPCETQQCLGLRLFYTEGWSYASFEGNSLLCNQTPLFHNHSTLTVAHPLHSTSSVTDGEKHTDVRAPPAAARLFENTERPEVTIRTTAWSEFRNLYEHEQRMKHVLCRPQWLLKPEIPQQFRQPMRLSEPNQTHLQATVNICWWFPPWLCQHGKYLFLLEVWNWCHKGQCLFLSACSQFTGWKVRWIISGGEGLAGLFVSCNTIFTIKSK